MHSFGKFRFNKTNGKHNDRWTEILRQLPAATQVQFEFTAFSPSGDARSEGAKTRECFPLLSFRAKSRNGASGPSDMDGCAARVAARESGDERVQSLAVP